MPRVKSIEQDADEWSHRYAAIVGAADGAAVDAS